jgi:hypothetical protein
MKIVVFDLDETMGYFTQFGIFWDSLSLYLKETKSVELTQKEFNDILDLFPEFLRPNIINILLYLKEKKECKNCEKIMIYTNNNGSKKWIKHIVEYFENKINYKLINQVISAFKINGKQIEICRTTHSKTHKDFIKCTKVNTNTEICFLDDMIYPDMINPHIYYINIKPYYYSLNFDYMLQTLSDSIIGKKRIIDGITFTEFMLARIKSYNYQYINKTKHDYELDKRIGKHILTHLKLFFNKNNKRLNNKTLKNKAKIVRNNHSNNTTRKKNKL